MQEQKYDMEVTEYRKRTMLETLAMLYADQMGMELKSIKIYPVDEAGKKLPEIPQKAVI